MDLEKKNTFTASQKYQKTTTKQARLLEGQFGFPQLSPRTVCETPWSSCSKIGLGSQRKSGQFLGFHVILFSRRFS